MSMIEETVVDLDLGRWLRPVTAADETVLARVR